MIGLDFYEFYREEEKSEQPRHFFWFLIHVVLVEVKGVQVQDR